MSPGSFGVHRRVPPSVPEHVPIRERDRRLNILRTCNPGQEIQDLVLEVERAAPGRSNSCNFLPLRRSCSSSLTSRNREQYFWCSWSAAQCSSEQCVGQPQSGHSKLTGLDLAFVCAWMCSCEEEQIGHGASCLMASPLSRIAGNGDFENGWKRLSSLSSGFGSAKRCSLRLKRPKKDRVCRGWASRSERRTARRTFIS